MAHELPIAMKQWVLRDKSGFGNLLLEEAPLPEIGDFDVLIKVHAVSLNYRDLMIAQGTYYWPLKPTVVPASDFAGEVLRAGPLVTRFSPGSRVAGQVHQTHIAGTITASDAMNSLGGLLDGGLRQYAAYHEGGLVEIPANLSWREGATLACAALTAWNALYGGAKALRPGETVLVQGTGGVSLFGCQFAKAGGAEVIATTSGEKMGVLRAAGAKHILNYKTNPDWGKTAKELSAGKRGADYVLEIGGPNTFEQSCAAASIDGTIAIIGTRAGQSPGTTLPHTALVQTRRIMIGSRLQFEEMSRAIEMNDIKPVVDGRVFGFGEVREAYEYLWEQKAVGKVVVDVE
ncbi:Zinc-type alcohol dehydrogenase-like protein [Lachnellula arida]|uniref:Zinc-type alcohol dehydrogenase-like protein n=1 Tax=Lachnellula arida TaxID=1316785 RepID=A0A8T9BK51_9HELO|nr:Zinc-type alcohol dehydrogenase-like protein [Lachnellula arida]